MVPPAVPSLPAPEAQSTASELLRWRAVMQSCKAGVRKPAVAAVWSVLLPAAPATSEGTSNSPSHPSLLPVAEGSAGPAPASSRNNWWPQLGGLGSARGMGLRSLCPECCLCRQSGGIFLIMPGHSHHLQGPQSYELTTAPSWEGRLRHKVARRLRLCRSQVP